MAVDHARRQHLQDQIAIPAADSLLAGSSVLISAPTGFGKTNLTLDVFRRVLAARPDVRILAVQDRQAVGEQNIERAKKLGISSTSLSIDGALDLSGQLAGAITRTLYSNLDKIDHRDIVWIDECHHATADDEAQHSAIIDAVMKKNPNAIVIGTSATLERADKALLHPKLMGAERYHVTYEAAMGCGAIVPPKVTTPYYRLTNGLTVSELADTFIDPMDPSDAAVGLAKALARHRPADFHQTAIREWRRANGGQIVPTFAYASTIKDAERLREAMVEDGVRAAVIHSGLSKKDRDQAFADYRAGRVDVLSSVDMLCEGVDITKTQSLLCLKETTSRAEWIQINGRGARAHTEGDYDKAFYTVIDLGASTYMHGDMTRYRKIENFIVNGPQAERTFSPWKTLSPDSSKTKIYGLHDGDRTLFAVKDQLTQKYMVFAKSETLIGRRKIATKHVKPFSNRLLTTGQIIKLGRDVALSRFDVMTTLESRPAGSNHRSIVERSFSDSKASVEVFVAARANARTAGAAAGISR